MEANQESKMRWIEDVRRREHIAEAVDKANEQHYEVCEIGARLTMSS